MNNVYVYILAIFELRVKRKYDNVAHKYDVDLHSEKFNDWDWYAVLNMSYSDHYHQGWNTYVYVELAKDYFEWKSNIS